MKNKISYTYFSRNNKNIYHENWVKRHNITNQQINFNKSYVLQRTDNKNGFIRIPYHDFFDCDCPDIDKKGHTLSRCNIYKRIRYNKLIKGQLININERNFKIKYKQFERYYKPNYNIHFYIKNYKNKNNLNFN
jgi:hypothetical protein